MEPLHIFFHVATIGRWSVIYDEILEQLQKSGLLNNATLHISVVGIGFDKDVTKYQFKHLANNPLVFEFPTLHDLWQHSQTHNGAVLYLHTKGATRPGYQVDCWRDLMLHFNVKRWQRALHNLHHFDATGCNVQGTGDGKLFFSGNFWWATTKYIRTLPDPHLFKQRIQGETWIGLGKGSFTSLHSSGVNHYTTVYPSEKYINL